MKYTLSDHMEKSFDRLSKKDYLINDLLNGDRNWPGDWEGRALLAFCSLYSCLGKKATAMDEFIARIDEVLNEDGFVGERFNPDAVNEQQLSGNGWFLSSLCEYYKLFGDEKILGIAKKVFTNLFYAALPAYNVYPLEPREKEDGGVGGHNFERKNGWILSTDVGCAFIGVDGVSRYFELTKDEKAKEFMEKTAEKFCEIDKMKVKAQTHATLTASRAYFRFYKATGNKKYFDIAKDHFELYIREGMTYTYENFNWFNRRDTWTEPCAVTDSLILALWFYNETKDEYYKTLSRRIWFNGLSYCHRDNGGAGPNSCVSEINPSLKIFMYEAQFCCTMRYAEGLKFAFENKELFENGEGEIITDELGRKFSGDLLIVTDEEGCEHLLPDLAFMPKDGKIYKVY